MLCYSGLPLMQQQPLTSFCLSISPFPQEECVSSSMVPLRSNGTNDNKVGSGSDHQMPTTGRTPLSFESNKSGIKREKMTFFLVVIAVAATMYHNMMHMSLYGSSSPSIQGDDSSLPSVQEQPQHQQEEDEEAYPLSTKQTSRLTPNLYIYSQRTWDAAPIVVEEFKLIFFSQPKVACTTFKQLFRRMSHIKNWQSHHDDDTHNPAGNQLKYLNNYPSDLAYQMMTSPEWTRAIFVRDPKRRALSSYLDKGVRNNGLYIKDHCCREFPGFGGMDQCVEKGSATFRGFLTMITRQECCCDAHWVPQADRIDDPYWDSINFVGRFESLADDTKRLLDRVHAWDDFGAWGWGPEEDAAIFAKGTGAVHKTNAGAQLESYFNESGVEDLVEQIYAKDYVHPVLNFEKTRISG